MKTLIIIFIALSMFWANSAKAQDNIQISSQSFTHDGDSLYITFDFNKSPLKVSRNKAIYYLPTIVGDNSSTELPSIAVMGRGFKKSYDRKIAVMSKKQRREFNNTNESTLIVNSKGNSTHSYAAQVPYQEWMSKSALYIINEDCGCGKMIASSPNYICDISQPAPYTPVLLTAYIIPQVEAVKNRSIECEAIMDFVVAKSDLILDRNNNAQEMNKIIETLNSIKNDDKVTVTGINIYGYASPEGNIADNRKLSVDRALVLKSYLMEQYNYPASYYDAHFGNEDWDGLVRVLKQSDKPYAGKVIEIIENTPDLYTRKSLIEQLQNGEPYKEMLQLYYPSLRRVVFKASFEVDQFNIDEAKALVHKQPEYLSLNELYLVANTYQPQSGEFKEMFDIAAKTYPTNDVANINAATNAIQNGNYELAQQYLVKVDASNTTAQYSNAKGIVVLMLNNDIEKAESYFKQAASMGLKEANNNLTEIEKLKNK